MLVVAIMHRYQQLFPQEFLRFVCPSRGSGIAGKRHAFSGLPVEYSRRSLSSLGTARPQLCGRGAGGFALTPASAPHCHGREHAAATPAVCHSLEDAPAPRNCLQMGPQLRAPLLPAASAATGKTRAEDQRLPLGGLGGAGVMSQAGGCEPPVWIMIESV